jgi:hypothetical protein
MPQHHLADTNRRILTGKHIHPIERSNSFTTQNSTQMDIKITEKMGSTIHHGDFYVMYST